MAKTLLGSTASSLRGTIDNIIFYEVNGKTYARSKPGKMRNYKPSALQKLHQESFKAQHALAKSVKKSIIDRIWAHQPLIGGMTPYSLFIKTNRAAFGRTNSIAFPELLQVSIGNLIPASALLVQKEENSLKISWDASQSGILASKNDRLNIVLLIDRKQLRITPIEAKRGDGKAELSLPENIEFTEGYIFWSSSNEELFSPSIWFRG